MIYSVHREFDDLGCLFIDETGDIERTRHYDYRCGFLHKRKLLIGMSPVPNHQLGTLDECSPE